jgi:flagellar motility protein MotE (MotC chaperone)
MKKLLPYIIVFVLTTVISVVAAVVFVKMRPPATADAAPVDSTAMKALVEKMYGPRPEELHMGDNTAVAPVAQAVKSVDSTKVLQLALEDERKKSAVLADRLRAVMDSSNKALAAADSAQAEYRKSMIKVLENMDPSSAARILSDFPDGDIKTYLHTMKKRQAAKILAALQPDRAARIMR